MRKAIKSYIEVAPYLLVGLILTAVFVMYPMIKGIYISFFKYNVIKPSTSTFIEFDNYIKVFKDPNILIALRNTLLMAVITVPGQWFFGIMLAMVINLRFVKMKVFWRLIYYLPVISSWVVVSYLFRFLFADGADGIINYLLVNVFHIIAEPVSWLQNTWTANIAVWTVSIWKGVGWVMIMYLASLQSIPVSLYEAAEIDGAKGAATFVHITLPLMKPMTMFVIINLINGAMQAFIQVYLITQGGPLDSTQLLNTYMYKQAFQFFDFGYASAISVLMGIMIFMFTYSQQRTYGKERIEY